MHLKAFERSRKIGRASDWLRGLLAYVYTTNSFVQLSLWSLLLGRADVSANDWRKRLQQAGPWLEWLLLRACWQGLPPSLRGWGEPA